MTTTLMTKIQIAKQLGAQAAANGAAVIPALDKELMALVEGVPLGDGIPIMRAWLTAFIEAPLPD